MLMMAFCVILSTLTIFGIDLAIRIFLVLRTAILEMRDEELAKSEATKLQS